MFEIFKKKEFIYVGGNLFLFGKDTKVPEAKMTTFDLILFSLIEELGESFYNKIINKQPTIFPSEMKMFLETHFKEERYKSQSTEKESQ